MARPKKTVAKKTAATTSTARGRAKQQTHDRSKMSSDLKTQTAQIKLLKGTATARSNGTRRPPNNPDMPQNIIDNLNQDFGSILELLDNFSQHLRALDRMRLNGVGIKKLGFIERAYELALENGEFLPHYLTLERFGTDIQYFMDFRSLTDLVTQIREKLWNITIQSADIAYTDAVERPNSRRIILLMISVGLCFVDNIFAVRYCAENWSRITIILRCLIKGPSTDGLTSGVVLVKSSSNSHASCSVISDIITALLR